MPDLLHTPEGVRDIIGQSCQDKHDTINAMMSVILSYGYSRMDTPGFEYIDTYSRDRQLSDTDDLYKFTGRDGKILSLRPDFTPSIARAAARYFSHESDPLRICYKGNVYRNTQTLKGLLSETTQLGAEFIGDATVTADAEIITMACNCIRTGGIEDFKISLGHSVIFIGVCQLSGLSGDECGILKDYIDNKNFYGMEDYLRNLGKDERLISILKKCLDVYEDDEAIDALLKELTAYKKDVVGSGVLDIVVSAVSYLQKLLDILKQQAIRQYITLDLGIIPRYDYYTGVVFYAYTYGSGNAILAGGRYNNLLARFGKDAPAIGFAIYCDDLLNAKEKTREKCPYITVALGKGRLAKKAFSMFEKLGIHPDDYEESSRKLIVTDEQNKIRFFFAKVPDVPTYVEHGVADIGIVGKDTVLEENRKIYEVLDLKFGKCKMCVCGKPEAGELIGSPHPIKVASKYPAIAKEYFNNRLHQDAEIIKLNGSIELAPILELTDVIVDIVETGSTLRENGLVVLEEICDLSARMLINPVTMRMNYDRMRTIIEGFREIVENDQKD